MEVVHMNVLGTDNATDAAIRRAVAARTHIAAAAEVSANFRGVDVDAPAFAGTPSRTCTVEGACRRARGALWKHGMVLTVPGLPCVLR